MQRNSNIQPSWSLYAAVLVVLCLSFLNMLYCTMGYEFGWGPRTILAGPEDRFADVLKLSLSFRSVTGGVDKTEKFQTWPPIYQRYFEHPDYGGVQSLGAGELTHFHHPPLSTLIFLSTGLFIVWTGSPTLTLILFFCVYLLEVGCLLWIGIPRSKRRPQLVYAIWFFCLASYPALVMFGRGNYVNAGLTTVPAVAFLVAIFAKKEATFVSLLALALAVNIHPNAIIFLLALPLVLGVRKAIRPSIQFVLISFSISVISYFAAQKLYPDYTLSNFRKGVAIYGKIYISGGAGIRLGSSLFGLIRALNRVLHLGIPFPLEIRVFYILAVLVVGTVFTAYWRASLKRKNSDENDSTRKREYTDDRGRILGESSQWPLPLVPFLLVSSYCVLSPVFADYHLLVFLAPLILTCLDERETMENRSQLLMMVTLISAFMLSPKNYPSEHASIQIALNPIILCATLLWIAMALLNEAKRQDNTTAELRTRDRQ